MSTRALVLHPHTKMQSLQHDPEVQLQEACGLAQAIYLDVISARTTALRSVRPATYLGKGRVGEQAEFIAENDIELVIMDCALTPVQQHNLEQAWKCKVIDRTALILEIFGERAKTKEGVLQVELAALEYQKSRLVRSWTHLERQRGGYGFMGGPGERQIEVDRRIINDRIARIKKQLEKVRKTRGLHRKSRSKVPYPVVALVGYTNAGKSTLFNRLTGADVYVEDLLFATLDPTMRVVKLPSGRKIILSDTVGFISQLPTELIAAFRATLEEVIEADIICHVRDISSTNSDEQKRDVFSILSNLGLSEKLENNLIEVANKIDLMGKKPVKNLREKSVPISALKGTGCRELLKTIDEELSKSHSTIRIELDAGEGKLISWIHAHGENVVTRNRRNKIIISADMSAKNISRLEKIRGQ